MTCPFLFTTPLAQHKYIKYYAYARSMCMQFVGTSSKCGNSKTTRKCEKTLMYISCGSICAILQSKHRKEKLFNIFDAIREEFGKNT